MDRQIQETREILSERRERGARISVVLKIRDVIECGFPVQKKWFNELLHD
jgi:hypothetical protein